MEFTIEKNRVSKHDEHGKLLAEVLFPDSGGGTVAITHTFVDKTLRGQGIADQLLRTAVNELRTAGKKIRPLCSYAVKWFENHPEHGDLIAGS